MGKSREPDLFALNTMLSLEFRCRGCWSFAQLDVFLFQQTEDRPPLAFVCLRIKQIAITGDIPLADKPVQIS